MSSKNDLKKILANLQPTLREESFIFMHSEKPIATLINNLNPIATFIEDEGSTLVISKEVADENSIHYETVFRCISLGVHSSLESCGLIAKLSGALTEQNIPTNVFAGYFHDHIFVPSDKAKRAMVILSSIESL